VTGIHCTLLHAVGLAITDVDTDALLKEIQISAQRVQPFKLTFDRPAVGNDAVEISGWLAHGFTEIVNSLTKTMIRSGALFTPAPSRYPHVSVAYASDGAETLDDGALRAALADIDRPLSATVNVERLHLVEQWHDGTHIMWHPIATVPLAVSTA
jgi:hypothetical protein